MIPRKLTWLPITGRQVEQTYHRWTLWLAYRPRIVGEIAATGEVGGWDWATSPVRRAA